MTIIKFKLKSDEEKRHFPFVIRELLVGAKQFTSLDGYHLRAM